MDIINIIMIIWIASYPKSGNTWVRSFLSNYFSENKNFDFSQLKKILRFPRRGLYEELDINFKDFKNVAANWINMQEYINLKNETVYLKTHNAMVTINNSKFTDSKNTLGFIYLVRDPRDVLLSYSSHLGISAEETFKLMEYDLSFEVTTHDEDFRNVILGSWASNYNSWKSFKSVKGLIIKYEDLVKNTEPSFVKIINYLNKINNVKIDSDKIRKCINNTNFNILKNLEADKGFGEKGKNTFFRKGKIGDWKKNLDPKIVNKIEIKFNKEMKELGYL